MDKIKILKVEPGKPPCVKEIANDFKARLRNMQKAFEELMEVFDKKDLSLKENKEEFVKKCMSLTMECIKAHIFVATEYEEPIQRKEMRMECSQ